MKFSESEFINTITILASHDYQAIPIKVAAPASGTVVKAGTPLTETGESTTGDGAVGILLYDVDTERNPNGALLVDGIIDATKAQAHSEVTYGDGLAAALPNIIFRTNIGVND